VFDDVKDLMLDGFRADTLAPTAAALWLKRCRGATIRGSRTAAVRNFVRVSGAVRAKLW